MSRQTNNRTIVCLFLTIVGTILLICFYPADADSVYRSNYLVDSFCLIISILMMMGLYCNGKLDLFDPIVTIGGLYIVLFFYAPIHDIINRIYLWYGYNLFSHAIKATLIAFLGYVVFFLFYNRSNHIIATADEDTVYHYESDSLEINNNASGDTITLIILMFIISFFSNAIYLVLYNGNSLLYILFLGFFGSSRTYASDASLGFLSMLSYSLPTITMLYWEYGSNRILKGIMFYLMLILQVVRGFRFFVVQIAISFFSYHFLKKGTRPKLRTILTAGIIAIVPILLMTMFRDSIRAGHGINTMLIDSNAITDAFDAAVWENFRIYRNFYGMVDVIPSVYPYVFGRQIVLGTLIMFIPRILWPGKISSYGGVGLPTLIGSALKGTGQAYPTLGEYYYSMGVFGVIFFMAIYGSWARKQRNKKNSPQNILDIIEYSVLLGCNLQLIIRGYFPSNFWYLVFSILPITILKHSKANR